MAPSEMLSDIKFEQELERLSASGDLANLIKFVARTTRSNGIAVRDVCAKVEEVEDRVAGMEKASGNITTRVENLEKLQAVKNPVVIDMKTGITIISFGVMLIGGVILAFFKLLGWA